MNCLKTGCVNLETRCKDCGRLVCSKTKQTVNQIKCSNCGEIYDNTGYSEIVSSLQMCAECIIFGFRRKGLNPVEYSDGTISREVE